jgi:hypothetical protein
MTCQLEKVMSQTLRAGRLERRAREIVESLNGSWSRGKGMCVCPSHDDRSPSLSVTLGRTAILFHCFAGCSNEEVIAALGRHGVRARDLFDGSGAPLADPEPRKEGPDRNARRVWAASAPLNDSLAERYLLARSIRQFSPELRFDNQTPLGPRDRVRFLPAMIAAVRTDLGVIAVHRSFLDPGGGLAHFQQPRRALGSLGTGAVRLAPPRDGVLGLAEGIETALSAMQLFQVPCWATLGNERFGLVTIPEGVRKLHLFLDHDAGGDLAEARAHEAYEREDRRFVTRRPNKPGFDWNDVLQRQPINAS